MLRYLSDCYRALRSGSAPALLDHLEISAITERLRTMIRDTDSSLFRRMGGTAQGPADEPVAP